MSRVIAVADIGGTNARFALADIDGETVSLVGDPVIFSTSDYPYFEDAWRAFAECLDGAQPEALGLAFAGPVDGNPIRLTNNDWTIDRVSLERLGVRHVQVVNDFGAVAQAAAVLGDEWLLRLCGPGGALPRSGVCTVLGPGTGLGVATIYWTGADWTVVETEGGHIGFAPTDQCEDRLAAALRHRFGRVSAERIASGPGLANLHSALTGADAVDEKTLWASAIEGSSPEARSSLDRWCAILGGIAGDLALAQGARSVIVAGGLGYRLRNILAQSGFGERFAAKAPFQQRMEAIPVRILAHPHAGLIGAAVAVQRRLGAWAGGK